MPSRPSNVSALVPILPTSFPPLVRRPTARRRHFCARVQQGGAGPKKQNRRKGHLQARRAVLVSSSVPIFPHRKTAYSCRQRPAQGIKQPRPAPSGVSRGIVICSGPWRGRRSALCQRPTRRKTSGRTQHPLAFYLFSLD